MRKTMSYSTSGTVLISIILRNYHSFCYRKNKIYSRRIEILFHVLKNDGPIQKYEYRNIHVLGEIKTLYIP